jgi:RNA polymerase sigma-70 factor (ECF subfamily)
LSTNSASGDATTVNPPAHTPDGKHAEDKALVMDVLAGKPAARSAFVERMRVVPRVLAARNRRLGRPLQEAELADLVQETLLHLWRKLASYRGDASLETWAYSFSSLELSNALRKRAGSRRREDAGAVPEPFVEDPAPPDDELAGLLRHLSPREADAVRLVHVDSLGLREVADRLEISVSSVKTHYYRGLEKLRAVIEAEREVHVRERKGMR